MEWGGKYICNVSYILHVHVQSSSVHMSTTPPPPPPAPEILVHHSTSEMLHKMKNRCVTILGWMGNAVSNLLHENTNTNYIQAYSYGEFVKFVFWHAYMYVIILKAQPQPCKIDAGIPWAPL